MCENHQTEIDALRRAVEKVHQQLKDEADLVKKREAEIARLRQILDNHDITYVDKRTLTDALQ